ncbi:MAG: VOC family protein [Acidobacteria bacterium]|nr:VOC family protein [Acidobacteriota bacterium]
MLSPRPTPAAYLVAKDAAKAIEFYTAAFGAKEEFRLTDPAGIIGHAEIAIGNSFLMLADEHPSFGALSPATIGGCPVFFHLAVENADVAVERALNAGATLVRPVQDQFYGERSGMVADPFGYRWMLGSPIEEVSPEEMQRRYAAMFVGKPSA